MNWTQHVETLKACCAVQCRPKGNSMRPRILSGQLITIEPVGDRQLQKNDIVFCKVGRRFYIHLISRVARDGRYQISNTSGRVHGWTKTVYGIITKVED